MNIGVDGDVTRDVIGGDSRNQSVSIPIDLRGLVADINAAAIANARTNAELVSRIETATGILLEHHESLTEHRSDLAELRSEFDSFRSAAFALFEQLSAKSDGIVNKMAIQEKMQEIAMLMGNK